MPCIRSLTALGLLAAVSLTACFHGGDDGVINDPPTVTEVPASAGASTAAYTAFVAAQAASSSETAEPLGTDLIVLAPTSEAEEPVAVN